MESNTRILMHSLTDVRTLFLSQALYTMMEKDVQVSGRPKDQELLKTAADAAAQEFEEKIGYKVKLEVNEELGDKS